MANNLILELDLGIEIKIRFAIWTSLWGYAFASIQVMEYMPVSPWQRLAVLCFVGAFFLKWFIVNYYLADLDKLVLYRCIGNRFGVSKTPLMRAEDIHCFTIDLLKKYDSHSHSFHHYYQMCVISKDGVKEPLTYTYSDYDTPKILGTKVARAFDKDLFEAGEKGYVIRKTSQGKIILEDPPPLDLVNDVNWTAILLVMTPIVILFFWAMNVLQRTSSY